MGRPGRPAGTGPGAPAAYLSIATGISPRLLMSTTPQAQAVLGDQLLQTMAERGGVKQFPANAVLVTEDDDSDSIFILLKGKVKVYGAGENGREVIYTTLGPGEYFGEMTLDGGPRSASVMTLEPTTCVVVPGSQVRDFLGSHPDFALHLVRKLIGLARRSTDTVKSLALDDVYTRIRKLLVDMAIEQDGRQFVAEKLTQQDIADRIGSSREMVSRIFKQLTLGGYIANQGRQIELLRKLPLRW